MKKLFKSAIAAVTVVTMVGSVMASCLTVAVAEEDKGAQVPTYEQTIEAVERANDYFQTVVKATQREGGGPNSFWHKGALHVGNMEAYYTTGIEAYRKYSNDWANNCGWKGNVNSGPKEKWTYGYSEDVNSTAVLFGDFQICFQTYIDLYNIEKNESKGTIADEKKIARALEVMGYECDKDFDGFWWWADSLFMVMPVMTKLYHVTGDIKYLDSLYEYFKFAKELMYDGPGGIPTSAEGYTTSAKLKPGANYSDPDNYSYLFFRDANYVYPLKPNPGHENEKNFWARGDGWVFAGLAKVLNDMPDDYEHYDEFYNTFVEMAPAIKNCMRVDNNGYGFWTQSMLQNYPLSADNPYGYETSGTAFFVYGLAWGINSGILPRDEYMETTVRAWNYLNHVALQEDGLVGYVQPIGSNATQATKRTRTQNFGVGAFLLAGCEMSRLVGGNQGDIYPYLQKKLQSYLALRVNTPNYYKDGKLGHIDENDHSVAVYLKADNNGNSTSMIPARLVVESFGGTVTWNEAAKQVTATIGDREVVFTVGSNIIKVNGVETTAPVATEITGGRTFVPLRALAESLGKKVYWNQGDAASNGLIVIGHKATPFYSCDANCVEMLRTMLTAAEYPVRPQQPKKEFVLKLKELTDTNRIQASKALASEEPEAEHKAGLSTDGNFDENSRWVGAKKGCNITYTYDTPVEVGQVALTFWKYDKRTTNFKLEYTVDGTNWKQVYDGASKIGNKQEIFDINSLVKMFKITGNGNSENNYFSLIEFAVYKKGFMVGTANQTTVTDSTTVTSTASTTATGTKLNISASSATFSQEPEGNNPGRNAFDNNASTVWASKGTADVVIDLGSETALSAVGVQFMQYSDDRTIPYSIYISNDKTSWSQVFAGSSESGNANFMYSATDKTARYVKIQVEGSTKSGWSSVAEIEIRKK